MEVEIALTAWTNNPARLKYFDDTVGGMRRMLTASRYTLTRILVCSEELPEDYRARFESLCFKYSVDLHYHPEPPEIGRNHNFLLSLCEAPYVLFTEDDCHQHMALDLSDDIDFLEAHPEFVYVRYSLTHPCHLARLSPIIPGLGELDQTEPYPYSNRAHLRHRERFATLGPFAEDGSWGAQEIGMGEQVQTSSFRIAGRVPNYFGHMGRFSALPSRWREGEHPGELE